METADKKVVVLGAGLAGLTAAHYLASAGLEVTIVEAEAFVGGRLATAERAEFSHGGRDWSFPIEHGLHGIWNRYYNVRRLLAELDTDELVPVPDQLFVVKELDGELLRFEVGARLTRSRLPDPFAPLALLASSEVLADLFSSGWRSISRVAQSMTHALSFEVEDVDRYNDTSVAEFIEGWPPLLARLFGVLTHTGFFEDPEEVSLAAFLTGLRTYVFDGKHSMGFEAFPSDPEAHLFGPLRERLLARGGEILLSSRAESLDFEAGRASRVRLHDGRSLEADAFVVALDPPGAKHVLKASDAPPGVPSASVRFWYEGVSPSGPVSGVFSGAPADCYFWLQRLHDPFRDWHRQNGGSVIECHLYGARARAALEEEPKTVRARVGAFLEGLWPELGGRRVHEHLRINASSHVCFQPGTMTKLPGVQTRWPNVAQCGDWIALDWPTLYLERACTTGLMASRQIASTLGLAPGLIPEPIRVEPSKHRVRLLRNLARLGVRSGLAGPTG